MSEGEIIAYFCAEYGITDKLPIYSGGLGVLAGDIVQEAAAQQLPFVAIGLFYKHGYFHQFVDTSGQHESHTVTNPADVPLHLAVDDKGETVLIEIPIGDRTVYAQIWKFDVGHNALFLLDTDHWKNSDQDKTITDQLYNGDQTRRIEQELILGIGGYRALERLGIAPTVFHMNEGHAAFLSLERTAHHLKTTNNLDAALDAARKELVFTNHTLVPAGNDAFPQDMIRTMLGKYLGSNGVGIDTALRLGDAPEKPNTFSMTLLALRMTYKSNAVSKLHAKKAKELWPSFNLEAITNGVHLPAWVAPEWQKLFDEVLPDWKVQTDNEKLWRNLSKVPAERFWEIHTGLKKKMLKKVYEETGAKLEEDVLTVVWARRFATYKRPDLLFNDIERLKKLVFSSDRPIQIIIAGKSHPADQQGKDIIAHIEYLANYDLKRRAVFVDDYSISLSRYLVAGADVWLNTPIFGLEASGTSGMKAAANGALQFTTPDGWAWEVDWYGLGFTLPIHKAESHIYDLFEKKIIPTYYKQDKNKLPQLWIAMMRETIMTVAPRFSSTRMVNDYVKEMYSKRPR